MLRRFFSLLLIPAMLTNQVAFCLGHSHSGNNGDGPTVPAHIHLAGHSHSHHSHDDHSHSHFSDGDDSHDHAPDGHHPVGENENRPAQDRRSNAPAIGFDSELPVPAGHDDDAIYLGDQETILGTQCRIALPVLGWNTFACDVVAAPADHQPLLRSRGQARNYRPYSRAIFLQIRVWLI